jgi:hypothetical protein
MNRRDFLKGTIATAAGLGLSQFARANSGDPTAAPAHEALPTPKASADAMILIWLPGGVAQTDTWDPKKHTPYTPGMRGNQMRGTCPSMPTSADGIRIGAGFDNLAKQMHHATILRSLTNQTKFGAIHLKAQYYMMTGYLFPSGVKAPSMGAVVSRTLGRRNPLVPGYIDLCRDINTSDQELLFINDYQGPGFYGVSYAPFVIPQPSQGLPTLNAIAGMKMDRLDRRQKYLQAITGQSQKELQDAHKVKDYMKVMEDARAMMDSPVKKAIDFAKDEKPEIIKAYDTGHRFSMGCLLARRLVEAGARFIEVEYQYQPFGGFDMHADGRDRMVKMKEQVDKPIARLIQELHERGLLERTLVVIATEFGRTIANQPSAGQEPDGFAEKSNGSSLVIENEHMYGFHGHFSSCNCMVFFGGGFKKGFVYGKTNEEHPMLAVENPVELPDVHATIYKAMGIAPDTNYVTEGRPFFVTNNGKGRPIDAMLA